MSKYERARNSTEENHPLEYSNTSSSSDDFSLFHDAMEREDEAVMSSGVKRKSAEKNHSLEYSDIFTTTQVGDVTLFTRNHILKEKEDEKNPSSSSDDFVIKRKDEAVMSSGVKVMYSESLSQKDPKCSTK